MFSQSVCLGVETPHGQCRRNGGEAGTNYGGREVGKGVRGPDYVAYVLLVLGRIIICRLYISTISDQTEAAPQLTGGLSDLV